MTENAVDVIHKYIEKYRQNERIPLIILLGIGLFFIIDACYWLSSFRDASLPNFSAVAQQVEPAVSSISQWHIFGNYNRQLENIPETSLVLTLEGVMLDLNNPKHSYVIVSSPSTPASAYTIGDALPGGPTLSKILQQQIVINNQGTLQSLSLPVDEL